MMRISATPGWSLLVAFCALTADMSLGLTAWLDLHPGHRCIFQRQVAGR